MANLIVCCDGTWNTPDERQEGVPTPTNVVRIYNAISRVDKAEREQKRYYHPGVGTNGSWWDKAVGGATGAGLNQNIVSAYRYLCEEYADGDDIFLFGFSRGAYTARSLAGMVGHCGLLDTSGLAESEKWARINRLFQNGYRRKSESHEKGSWAEWAFHDKRQPIRFVGVWDTVGALGIPEDMALLGLLNSFGDHTFHDTDLGSQIQTARHAVALDEMRATFQPTLWTNVAGRDIKQLWFAGVHSDVGGGYRETGLSDCALLWMMTEAEQCGLSFEPAMKNQVRPDFQDTLHESCSGVFSLLPTQPRSRPCFKNANAFLHPSALDRQKDAPIHQSPYWEEKQLTKAPPLAVDVYARQTWNATGLWLEAGKSYTFAASGEWMDASITCGPGGTSDGHFQLGELAQVFGSMLGEVEQAWKRVTGRTAADFKFTKRHEQWPWFSLIGAIANGGGVDAKQHLEPHETFLIAAGCTYKPKKSGYFYAYANDAWNCYGNNKGLVRLTIS
jgi:Uncharacterized alpha/beta hydrolase domain (DUF2235)